MAKVNIPEGNAFDWSLRVSQQVVQRLLDASSLRVFISDHARQQMNKRGVLEGEVLETIGQGTLTYVEHPNVQHVKTTDVDWRFEKRISGRIVRVQVAASGDRLRARSASVRVVTVITP